MTPEIRVSAIGRQGGNITGNVVCADEIAHFCWDKNTDGLRLFQKTRFLKREVPPAEVFFIHKTAITDAIVHAVEQFLDAEADANKRSLEELIAAAQS